MECRYCEAINDRIPISDSDIDYGVLGKSKLSLYVQKYKGKSYLSLSLDNYGLGGRTHSKLSHIHFCPMCGRELENEGDRNDK